MLTASSQSLPAVIWPRPALKAALRGGAGCLKPPPSNTPGKRDPPRLPSQPRQRMRYNAAVTRVLLLTSHLYSLQHQSSHLGASVALRGPHRRIPPSTQPQVSTSLALASSQLR
jgi:hypothetical protein